MIKRLTDDKDTGPRCARPTSPGQRIVLEQVALFGIGGERGAAAVRAELLELLRVHPSVPGSVHHASFEAVTAWRFCVEPGRLAAGLDDARDGQGIGGRRQCRGHTYRAPAAQKPDPPGLAGTALWRAVHSAGVRPPRLLAGLTVVRPARRVVTRRSSARNPVPGAPGGRP